MSNLQWDPNDGTPGRWHLVDRGIHAGDIMELEMVINGATMWVGVRIENDRTARRLFAYIPTDEHIDDDWCEPSPPLVAEIDTSENGHFLRWPEK